jgi:hypothetical protein
LRTADGKILGALDLASEHRITPDAVRILDCFAVLAVLLIYSAELKNIVSFNHVGIAQAQFIGEYESAASQIPKKLRVSTSTLGSFKFDAPRGTASASSRYLTYRKMPDHNRDRTGDVMQFFRFELFAGQRDGILTRVEILARLVAALCHDTGHDSFSNTSNVRAEAAPGILFTNQERTF